MSKARMEMGVKNEKDRDQGKWIGKNIEGKGPFSDFCTLMKRIKKEKDNKLWWRRAGKVGVT
jgi:hypothetical protein